MSKDLIKWSELSRKISGSDNSIRPNKIPKKYQHKVDRLFQMLEDWERWTVQGGDLELVSASAASKDRNQSLLDQFAMAAMQGELAAQSAVTTVYWANDPDSASKLAERAYDIAEAMMKEREKRMKQNGQT